MSIKIGIDACFTDHVFDGGKDMFLFNLLAGFEQLGKGKMITVFCLENTTEIFRKYIPLVAVSLIVAFIYGSTIWSISPIAELVDASISWEGHLSGAISGLIFALVFRKEGPQKPEVVWEEEAEEAEEAKAADGAGGDDGLDP